MIVLNILGYFGRNKQNSYAALTHSPARPFLYILRVAQLAFF